MKTSEFKTIFLLFFTGFLLLDMYMIISYSDHAAEKLGWGKIAGAFLIQIFTILIAVIGIVRKISSLRKEKLDDPIVLAYRHYVPMTALGVLIVGTILSINLLHLGILCPSEGALLHK